MKKAIVTGATGFIGQAVVKELLKQNVEVTVLIRENSTNIDELREMPVRIVACDMKDIERLPDLVLDRDIEAVFHMAWQGVSDSDAKNQDIQIMNMINTLKIIDVIDKMNIKTFVGAGSMHEAESIIEMQEDKIISNMGYMYKASKMATHWMAKAKAGSLGIRFFWPLINTYGEGERSARLINTVIRSIFAGKIPELSSGEQYYDFVYVSDVAHALYLIASYGVDGTNYVIGSGKAGKLKKFLNTVGEIANEMKDGEDVPLGFGKIKNNVIKLPIETFDISRLVQDTGFKPEISFEEGVRRTAVAILRENQS